MNSRQRFLETMRYGSPDRVPLFDEGLREGVLKTWRRPGLIRPRDLERMFRFDRREEIEPDLESRPKAKKQLRALEKLQKSLDPEDPGRLPKDWSKRVRAWKNRDHILILWIHRGFFLSLGVGDWTSFTEAINLLNDEPHFVREAMAVHGRFAAGLAEKILKDVQVDAALFVEPIAGNDGPLISPKMYEEFVLKSYEPALEVFKQYGVETIIFLTFANSRRLLPSIVKWGFNCLWACEVNPEAMDYQNIRREFGRDLRLIGGIDLDALRSDQEAVRRELEEKVPPLLAQGGYIPLADGRVREDTPFENYFFYRRLLEKMVGGEDLRPERSV